MKKNLIGILALATILSATACGSASTEVTEQVSTQSVTEIVTVATTEANPIDSLTAEEENIFECLLIGVKEFESPEEVKILDIGEFDSISYDVMLNVESPDDFERLSNEARGNANSFNAVFHGGGYNNYEKDLTMTNEYNLYIKTKSETHYKGRLVPIEGSFNSDATRSTSEMVSHINKALNYHWNELGLN